MDTSTTKSEMQDFSGPNSTSQPVIDSPPPYTAPGLYPGTTVITTASIGGVGTNIGTNAYMNGMSVGVVGANIGHGTAAIPVIVAHQVSPKPMPMICRSCNADITTRVEKKPSLRTHFFAALMFLMGCWCCCCIPYFTDSCLNSDHYCPNCNAYIGSHKP